MNFSSWRSVVTVALACNQVSWITSSSSSCVRCLFRAIEGGIYENELPTRKKN